MGIFRDTYNWICDKINDLAYRYQEKQRKRRAALYEEYHRYEARRYEEINRIHQNKYNRMYEIGSDYESRMA